MYAATINEVLPDCLQVAGRFHLLQNLIDRLKDIFKAEMPSEIFIRDGKVIERIPEKVRYDDNPNEALMETLYYDNSKPTDQNGAEIVYDSRVYRPTGKQSGKQKENRKKNSD